MGSIITKILVVSSLSLMAISSYAIQVKVQTSFKDAKGIGFTVDGKKHGGVGTEYTGNEMPAGSYSFGFRYEDKDIGCTNDQGENQIKLEKDTVVTLDYKDGKCTLTMS